MMSEATGTATGKRNHSKERLTDRAIKAHVKTNTTPLSDGGGLYLRRTAAGNWYWYLQAHSPVTKKRAMFSICTGIPYPDAPLADARTQSDEYRKTISYGNDPTEAKRKIIDEQRKAIATREAAQRADA